MQISSKNRPIKIGVISLWGLTFFLIIFIVYIIGTNQKLFTSKYSLFMFLPNVQGLNPGAFITLSGLKVGVVGEMKFTKKDEHQGILVELKINREFRDKITTSSVATVTTMGMLGDKYVDISLGDLTDPVLKERAFIKTEPPLDIGAIASSATTVIDELQGTLKNIRKISEQALNGSGVLGMLIKDKAAQKNLAHVLDNLSAISTRIEMGRGNIGQFVQDTTLYFSLKSTASNLDKISTKIQNGEGSLGRMVSDTTLYVRLNSISMLTDSLLQGLEQGEGSAGKLLKDKELYDRLILLTKSLNELTEDIKKNPKKYVTIKVF